MPRPKSEPTILKRLPKREAKQLQFIADRLKLTYREAFRRIAGADINDLYGRMRRGEAIDLPEPIPTHELGGEG